MNLSPSYSIHSPLNHLKPKKLRDFAAILAKNSSPRRPTNFSKWTMPPKAAPAAPQRDSTLNSGIKKKTENSWNTTENQHGPLKKNRVSNTNLLFQESIFRCHVGFGECSFWTKPHPKKINIKQNAVKCCKITDNHTLKSFESTHWF